MQLILALVLFIIVVGLLLEDGVGDVEELNLNCGQNRNVGPWWQRLQSAKFWIPKARLLL